MALENPTIGRIVHFHGVNGEVVPAIVCRASGLNVDLCVFYPAMTPVPATNVAPGSVQGTWQWPPATGGYLDAAALAGRWLDAE